MTKRGGGIERITEGRASARPGREESRPSEKLQTQRERPGRKWPGL